MPTERKLSPEARLGHVHYHVADLAGTSAFYQEILGFQRHWQEEREIGLGAGGNDLLRLTELPDTRRQQGTAGLYHTAFLFPSQRELANVLKRIAERGVPIDGTSDHGTHWAIYLPDPEGNGIELAWDRPQEEWPDLNAAMQSGPDAMRQLSRPLYPAQVFAELDDMPWDGAHGATRVGHVHLYVSDLVATKRFYHDVLGFDTVVDAPGYQIAMFSAGGYHHHIGANTWKGAGLPPHAESALGIRHFTVLVPTLADVEAAAMRLAAAGYAVERIGSSLVTKDPSGVGLVISPEEGGA